MRWLLFALVVSTGASCGWLPPDKPTEKPAPPPDPDLATVARVWTVENHVLTGNTALTDSDALQMHGRKIEITATTYTSPFHGTCDGASRDKRTRAFADVAAEVDLAGESRLTAIHFGLPDRITEFRLVCNGNTHTPSLTIYVAGKRAMTCFSGVCYLLDA